MAAKSRKKSPKGRFNILLMRSQGEVLNLAVAPVLLVIAFLFALIFVVVSVNIINRYFALYLDHRDLLAAYEQTAEELGRLQSLYTYQASVADDYNNLMLALNRADPNNSSDADESASGPGEAADGDAQAASPETPPQATAGGQEAGEGLPAPPGTELSGEAVKAVDGPPLSLEDWAGRLPAVAAQPEQLLDVERLQVSGEHFSFSLINGDEAGRAAQGDLLMVFAVETPGGGTSFVTFPNFDLSSPEPDFKQGPGYNIRAGKTVEGRLRLPPGGVVTAVMVAAKSRAGNVVMKKLLFLEE